MSHGLQKLIIASNVLFILFHPVAPETMLFADAGGSVFANAIKAAAPKKCALVTPGARVCRTLAAHGQKNSSQATVCHDNMILSDSSTTATLIDNNGLTVTLILRLA